MPIAKSFVNDVFISYCHADNINAMGRGWIEVFHEALQSRLVQIIGARLADEQPAIWRDVRLAGNDEFPEVLADELRRAALVVSVLTPSYVGSTWCLREVDTFCQLAQQTGGLRTANKLRILKVLKTPVDRARHPSVLKDAIGFPFYVMDTERDIPREFTLSETDVNYARAKEAINDLAYSILGTLNALAPPAGALQPAATDPAAALPAAAAPLPFAGLAVYLAECHWQLDDARAQIRRELEDLGLRVLPEGELPMRNPQQFRQAVEGGLAASALAVHLVGARRASVVADEAEDSVALQLRLAAAHSSAAGLPRLVWLPDHLAGTDTVVDPVQQDLIARLDHDPATRVGAELLTLPLQGLVTRIHDSLQKLLLARAAAARSAAIASAGPAGPQPLVYLVSHADDAALAAQLRAHLFAQGLTVLEPLDDPGATDQERADIHRLNLEDCNAALLCAGAVRASWLPPQLSEMRKAVGWRNGRPLDARAVYLGPSAAGHRNRPLEQGVLVCDGSAGFNPAALQPFIDQVRAAAAARAAGA